MQPEVKPEVYNQKLEFGSPSEKDIDKLNELGLTYQPTTQTIYGDTLEPEAVNNWIEAVGQPERQCTVQFCFLNAKMLHGKSFDLEWFVETGRTGYFDAFRMASSPDNITVSNALFGVALTGAIDKGFVNVLSRPSIGVKLGATGKLSNGRKVAVASSNFSNGALQQNVEFLDVGYDLEVLVLPHGTGYSLEVTQTVAEVVGSTEIDGNPIPEITRDNLESVVLVNQDDWVMVGSLGIARAEETTRQPRLPFSFSAKKDHSKLETVLIARITEGINKEREITEPLFPEEPSVYARKLDPPKVRRHLKLFQKKSDISH